MRRILLALIVTAIATGTPVEAAYTVPRFIPDGSGGGVFQPWADFLDFVDNTCSTAQAPDPWTSEQPGFYFVDYDAINATDTGRPYGSVSAPRKTVPIALPAGSFVYLAANTEYARDHSGYESNIIVASGTLEAPVCIVGGTGHAIVHEFGIAGSYILMDGLKQDYHPLVYGGGAGTFQIFGLPNDITHHVVLRNAEITSDSADCGTTAAPLNCGGGVAIGQFTGIVRYVAVLDSEIHHVGDYDNNERDIDVHCIKVAYGTLYLWVLNNQIHHCGGDSAQVESRDPVTQVGVPEAARYLFFGGNTIHDNRQSGFWVKFGMDVIMASNDAYDITNRTESNSYLPVAFGGQYNPKRVWIVGNTVSNTIDGVRMASQDNVGSGVEFYVIGNLFRNGVAATTTINQCDYSALAFWGGDIIVAAWNTIYNWGQGYCEPQGHNFGLRYVINNLIDTIDEAHSGFHLRIVGSYAHSHGIVKSNVFKTTYREELNGGPPATQASPLLTDVFRIVSDTLMNNPSGGSFGLQAASPAVDYNTVALNGLSPTYLQRYGETLDVDYLGNPRYNGTADAGFLERPGVQPPPPPPPAVAGPGQSTAQLKRLTKRSGL